MGSELLYIISEKELNQAVRYTDFDKLSKLVSEIRSRPLSSALMKERERIHNALDNMKHVDNEKEYYVTVYLGDVRDIVNGCEQQ